MKNDKSWENKVRKTKRKEANKNKRIHNMHTTKKKYQRPNDEPKHKNTGKTKHKKGDKNKRKHAHNKVETKINTFIAGNKRLWVKKKYPKNPIGKRNKN